MKRSSSTNPEVRVAAAGRSAIAVLIALATCAAPTPAGPTTTSRPIAVDLARYVPADVLMAYWGRYQADESGDDHVVMRMLKWVELARQLNLIPREYRTISDVAGTLPVVGQYRHVIALMNVSSMRVGPEGYRLAHMEAAVVLDADGDFAPVIERIRRLLAGYTDKEFGKIEIIDRPSGRSYRLTDTRLPVWATWEWGPIGSCYVIGLGQGAFDRVLEAHADPGKSIEQDPWFANARKKCKGGDAMIEWLVNYRGIRKRLEPVVEGRPEKVLEALGAGDLHRGLAVLRMEGRYLQCYIMNCFESGDQFVPLSDPQKAAKTLLSAVPNAASCAIIDRDLGDWVRRIRNAYLQSQTQKERDEWHAWFAEIERRNNINTRAQLLDRLGKHLIIHSSPAHPLNLPMAFTLMLEIDDPAPVRDAIDAIMSAWQEWQRRSTTRTASTRPEPTTRTKRPRTRGKFKPRVGREPDGMWYLQAGIVRPAITVADKYIVISWSPEAVRKNLRRLREASARPASTAPTAKP